MKLHLVECDRFAAMRLVEERSLSSILRSNLLTTLINNDVSGKVNASGCANALDKFHALRRSFASEGRAAPKSSVKAISARVGSGVRAET